tara:strand:+ start:278 stop:703 length:426 start_codon:yes stop_codon:yes gene_type:complete
MSYIISLARPQAIQISIFVFLTLLLTLLTREYLSAGWSLVLKPEPISIYKLSTSIVVMTITQIVICTTAILATLYKRSIKKISEFGIIGCMLLGLILAPLLGAMLGVIGESVQIPLLYGLIGGYLVGFLFSTYVGINAELE